MESEPALSLFVLAHRLARKPRTLFGPMLYTPRARGDLAQILRYIDERNPPGALNVKRAIRRTIDVIGEFPQVGRLVRPARPCHGPLSLFDLLDYQIG